MSIFRRFRAADVRIDRGKTAMVLVLLKLNMARESRRGFDSEDRGQVIICSFPHAFPPAITRKLVWTFPDLTFLRLPFGSSFFFFRRLTYHGTHNPRRLRVKYFLSRRRTERYCEDFWVVRRWRVEKVISFFFFFLSLCGNVMFSCRPQYFYNRSWFRKEKQGCQIVSYSHETFSASFVLLSINAKTFLDFFFSGNVFGSWLFFNRRKISDFKLIGGLRFYSHSLTYSNNRPVIKAFLLSLKSW